MRNCDVKSTIPESRVDVGVSAVWSDEMTDRVETDQEPI